MPNIIIASGPVIVEDGKVLLKKDHKDEFWKFCGGKVEDFDSDFRQTAIREVREEMGLEVELLTDTPYLLFATKKVDDVDLNVILIHFLAKRLNEVSPGKDTSKWQWLKLKDLNEAELAPNIIPTLKYFAFI